MCWPRVKEEEPKRPLCGVNGWPACSKSSVDHQGKDNRILFPSPEARGNTGAVRCRERLGGLLKYYDMEAA